MGGMLIGRAMVTFSQRELLNLLGYIGQAKRVLPHDESGAALLAAAPKLEAKLWRAHAAAKTNNGGQSNRPESRSGAI